MIDRTKLKYRPGDIVHILSLNMNALIIGYLFSYGYNIYDIGMYGYTVILLGKPDFTPHNIGNFTYTFTGKKIPEDRKRKYWWVLAKQPIKLVKHSNTFLCRL